MGAAHLSCSIASGFRRGSAITSPEKGCGKTTLLDVLSRLVMRPLSTANVTASAIFRVVEMQRPTLLIDEADTFLSENEELRGILNSGHRQGGSVIRTVGEDFEPRSSRPIRLAPLRLSASCRPRWRIARCRSTCAGAVPDEPLRHSGLTAPSRSTNSRAKRHGGQRTMQIMFGVRTPTCPAGVFNRAADNWRPLLAIADAAGGEWPTRARRAAAILAAARATMTSPSASPCSPISAPSSLSAARTGFRPPNWSRRWSPSRGALGREWKAGKAITANGLARLLAPFGSSPSTIRTGDGTPKGYLLAQFEDAFARYLR